MSTSAPRRTAGTVRSPGRPPWNPLHEAYVEACRVCATETSTDSFRSYHQIFLARRRLVGEFAFSVPTAAAVRAVVRFAPRLVDFGAGTGYWARVLAEAGADVVALDCTEQENEYLGQQIGRWYPVQRGDVQDLVAHRDRALFLAWPPYQDDMAVQALRTWGGNRLVYVGEGDGGCCATDDFFTLLATTCVVASRHPLPQWPGIHDALWLYERAPGGER